MDYHKAYAGIILYIFINAYVHWYVLYARELTFTSHRERDIILYNIFIPLFMISSYGAPLAQRASYLALHSSLFGPVNCDYIVSNSINCLLIGSRCIPNGTHTKHCWANLAHASKHIKDSDNNLIIVYLTLHTSLLMNYKIKQVNSNDKRLKRKVKLVVAGVNFRATHWWLNPVALIVRAGSHLVVLAHWSEYLWL